MNTQQLLTQFITGQLLHDNDGIELSGDDELLISGLIDSLGVIQLVTFIEANFDVEVRPEDVTIENFSTINVVAAYLERQRAWS